MGNGEYTTASAIANWCCLTLVELPTISLGLYLTTDAILANPVLPAYFMV